MGSGQFDAIEIFVRNIFLEKFETETIVHLWHWGSIFSKKSSKYLAHSIQKRLTNQEFLTIFKIFSDNKRLQKKGYAWQRNLKGSVITITVKRREKPLLHIRLPPQTLYVALYFFLLYPLFLHGLWSFGFNAFFNRG